MFCLKIITNIDLNKFNRLNLFKNRVLIDNF